MISLFCILLFLGSILTVSITPVYNAESSRAVSWEIEIVDITADVGPMCSMDIDSQGNLHVAYYDMTNYDLKYAKRDSSGWTNTTIDSNGITGWFPTLKVDSNDVPHIVYYDPCLLYTSPSPRD